MIKSMTGFAALTGAQAPFQWAWELRSVNGRGLDLRLRVPDWITGLEAGLRKKLGDALARGNVTCSLRLTRSEEGATLAVNAAQLATILDAITEVETRAMETGVSLAPARATDVLAMRGVLDGSDAGQDTTALAKTLLDQFDALLADFTAMRAQEGAALEAVIAGQLDEIENLVQDASGILQKRQEEIAQTFRQNLARVMGEAATADPDRVAQELALIAVKADVTEEIDRLRTHVAAARALIAQEGPVGRKLDFLTQEFNREANTLCAKAQHGDLTRIGLALKAVIDQMREQIQNVE